MLIKIIILINKLSKKYKIDWVLSMIMGMKSIITQIIII
jgi:hypothetical protein